MKALNYQEVTKIVEVLNKTLAGARLQKLSSLSNGVVLEFYTHGELYLLQVDLGKTPFVYLQQSSRLKASKKHVKPIEVFLRSHFAGSVCQAVAQPDSQERELELQFSDDRRISIQLSPNAKNISAYANSKSIHFNKPVDLPKSDSIYVPDSVRSYEDLCQQYKEQAQSKVQSQPPKKSLEQQKKKIQQDINKHKQKLESYKALIKHIEAYEGDWGASELVVPKELQAYYEPREPVYKNYELANEKFKTLEVKYNRAVEQLHRPVSVKPKTQGSSFKNVDVSTRKLELENGMSAYIGKSAKDNLLLLRSAKPWFLWLHLRDYPGAHVIVVKNKSQKLTPKELITVAQWLLKQQFKSKTNRLGDKFDVIYAECRYVRPIKGNKSGLVNYQNESTLTVKFE